MADITLLKQRLSNISSVHEITEAMQIITTILIGRSQKLLAYRRKIQPYFDRLLFSITSRKNKIDQSSPTEFVIAFFSEKGFVSSFNQQLLPFLTKQRRNPNLIIVGEKGKHFCERMKIPYKHFFHAATTIPDEAIIEPLYDILKENNFPWKTKIIINKYNNMFQQKPGIIDLFPAFEEVYNPTDAVTDVDQDSLDRIIIDKFVRDRLYYLFIQNYTGEIGSKLLVMKNAVENSELLKEEISKDIYIARQTAITQELSEVISAYKVLQTREEK
ncbi:MAG: F0F1 ATP synthase subunit gamma [Candidatus Margulisbacteria bacterium]|nr:F0F1 ATP synthase subunit gamma [Candidatus Margulisiibacteriota bacterium]